jgi:hypothetical protein
VSEEEDIDQLILDLIQKGGLEVDGIDSETGEFLYKVTDKMKDVNQELYDAHLNAVHSDTMYFWEKGFIDIEDITSKNPIIFLTTKAFDESAVKELPKDMAAQLEQIIKVLGN